MRPARTVLLLLFILSITGCASFGRFLSAWGGGLSNGASGGGGYANTITSDFSGFNYGNLYVLSNGQVWQQTEYYIWYYYFYLPKAIIYSNSGSLYLKVAGIDHAVRVQQVQ